MDARPEDPRPHDRARRPRPAHREVDGEIAGHVSEEAEHPGLSVVKNQGGRFMGRVAAPEKSAEFLAAWFVAEEQGWW